MEVMDGQKILWTIAIWSKNNLRLFNCVFHRRLNDRAAQCRLQTNQQSERHPHIGDDTSVHLS